MTDHPRSAAHHQARAEIRRVLFEFAAWSSVFAGVMLAVALFLSPGAINATVGAAIVALVLLVARWRT